LNEADEQFASLASNIRACEDGITTLRASSQPLSTPVTPATPALSAEELRSELRLWISEIIKTEVVPELKSTLAAENHSDVFQAASMCAYEKVVGYIDSEVAAQMDASQQALHRCSFDLRATLIRDTHGILAGEQVSLRHPIKKIAGVTYMHKLRRGVDAEVISELFPVEDADGPTLAFANAS